jgi:DNA polymerase-3 subunit beta
LLEGEETAVFRQVDNHLVFTVGERVLASKAVDGQFPAFEKVVAVVGDKQVTLERERLQSAVRRVSLLSSERSRALKVTLESGRLELLASSPDLGEARESLAVDYDGDAVEIGFNAQYLADFLAAAGTGQVRLELRDHDSQGLLRPVGEGIADHRYVVMPMRL